jgi:hypothetical protein
MGTHRSFGALDNPAARPFKARCTAPSSLDSDNYFSHLSVAPDAQ